MAAGTNLTEFPFRQGQDEGAAIQTLPVGVFSSMQNARYRKVGRIGKRNGYTAKTSIDADGNALGSGSGRLACLGPHFCVVDDRFYSRDDTADTWAVESSLISGSLAARRVLSNRFPECVPAGTLYPSALESSNAGRTSSSTFALGYLWTAQSWVTSGASAWTVTVEAHDPITGKVVYREDLTLTGASSTDTPLVQLLPIGQVGIALVADRFTAGVKTSLAFYYLDAFATGWSTPATFTCLQSACNVYPASSTELLIVYSLTGTPTTLRVGTVNPQTAVVTTSATHVAAGNVTLLSIWAAASGDILTGYFDAANVRYRMYSAAFAFVNGGDITGLVATATAPVLFADGPTGDLVDTFVLTFGSSTYGPGVSVATVTSGGVRNGTFTQQYNAVPLSWPFNVNNRVYQWVRPEADSGLSIPVLVRVPLPIEYDSPLADSPGPWPLQAVVDTLEGAPLLAYVPVYSGSELSLPVPTPLGYAVSLPYVRASFVRGGGTQSQIGFAVPLVRFRSEGVRYSPSCVVPCVDRYFVASAVPMWVLDDGTFEAGFPEPPFCQTSPTGAVAAGGLTSNVTYSYAAIFETRIGNQIERSAPSLPRTVAMGAADNITNARWSNCTLGERGQVTLCLYRTAANGSVFYLVDRIDVAPGLATTGDIAYTDTASDADIIQNEALYINIGQEVAASAVPACTFANVGGNRLWVGGGFRGHVVTASKQFQPAIVPEFADDDAFRVLLPSECTGMAWCDNQVAFTQDGIYVITGDGPDASGAGFFTLSRLPFDVGCVDWRSVVATDNGIFFQSARGLMLLPRGFGPPLQMSQVLDTLTTYPIITSAHSSFDSRGGADNSEQVVQWTAVSDEAATSGVVVTFDLAYQAFTVDTYAADYPPTFQAGWSGDSVQAPSSTLIGPNGAGYWHPFRLRDSSHSDGGLPITLQLATGDFRPWGTQGHGVINRVGLLGVLGSACTLSVTKLTDKGARATTRGYTGVAPDYVSGADVYLDVELGGAEQRDVTMLRFTLSESSAVEGMAFLGLVFEADSKPQGFRLPQPADRVV